MKKIVIAVIAIASIAVMAIYAQKSEKVTIDDERLIKLESLAEQGGSAALHRLIEFYDENSSVYVEVEEVIEPDGTEWSASEVDSLNLANKNNA